MANELFIPSMSQAAGTDNLVFTTSLADYRKQLIDCECVVDLKFSLINGERLK
jgi:hypothetical protein